MIRFNGMRPEQLGAVKCVTCADRFEAERQEIERGGMVAAALKLPTVRKIEAEFVVRAGSKIGLYSQIDRLAQWLTGEGEGKLSMESAPGHYYKARCTSVTPDEIKGTTARVKAVFTCDDYRRYAASSDEPDEDADPACDNFTFAGKHCLNDMGCMFIMDEMAGVPAFTVDKYEIGGLAGTLRGPRKSIPQERTLRGTLYFVRSENREIPLNFAEMMQRASEIAAWFGTAGRAELVFDEDPIRCWQAEAESEGMLDREDWRGGKIAITLTLQPIALGALTATQQFTVTTETDEEHSLDFTKMGEDGYSCGYTTPLNIKIEHKGGAALENLRIVSGGQHTVLGGALTSGQTLIIDSEKQEITLDGEDALATMVQGDFPRLEPWSYGVVLQTSTSGAQLDVTLTARGRWI